MIKQFLEYLLKLLPTLVVLALCYFLFLSSDSQLSEGVKLSLSALLGAIASYIFIQYSDFLKHIDTKKAVHQKALVALEVKLNNQLNWLSDVEFHLTNHIGIINNTIKNKNLIYDTSTYREPGSIETEIYDINNLNYKNQLLGLHTGYKKLFNDITTMQVSYKFMLEKAINDPGYIDSYINGLPNHLENIKALHQFSIISGDDTRNSLSSCRVLLRDSKNVFSLLRRYFILHDDPRDFDRLKNDERAILDKEIEDTKKNSSKIISDALKKA